MKTCNNCGATLGDDSLFCVKCGTKYEAPVEDAATENTDAVVETEAAAETEQQAPAVEPKVAPVSVPVLSEKEQKAAAKAAAKADKEAAKAAAKADKEAEKYNKAAAKAARVMPTANSAAAIAAFVISLVAIFNFLNPLAAVLSLFAIIFSIAGIVNTGRGKASGRGLAVAALILALVTLIIMASIVAVVIWVYDANIASITDKIDTAGSFVETIQKVLENDDFLESLTDHLSNNEGMIINIGDRSFEMKPE